MEGLTIKKLNAQIKSIKSKTAKWRDDVQLCLVGCAQFAFDDRNVDPCTNLVNAVQGADVTAVIHWIEVHMPAVWMKSEGKFRFNKSFDGDYDAITLMAEPWWELAKTAREVSSTFDALEAVRHLIDRIEREIKSGKKTVEHADVLKELKAVAGKAAKV